MLEIKRNPWNKRERNPPIYQIQKISGIKH